MANSQREEVRVGDLAMADNPPGKGALTAHDEFDVVGQEDMAVVCLHLAEQGSSFPRRNGGRDRSGVR